MMTTCSWVTVCVISIWIIANTLTVAADEENLGDFTIRACREGIANMTWEPPNGTFNYNYIDLYYTRKPEGGTYKQITVTWWLPRNPWQVVSSPTRFKGRLHQIPISDAPTTSFQLEHLIRIDHGIYQLFATTNAKTFVGTYNVIVYVEDNYYPDCMNTGNSTVLEGDEGSMYAYQWKKPAESPSIGVKMYPEAESGMLEPQDCYFGDEETCDVLFDRDTLEVTGRVYFTVEYLFPDNFTQCVTLDEPPTNLIIDIPPAKRLAASTLAGIVISCAAVIVIGCVVPPLVTRYLQQNKAKMSLKQCLTFVSRCVDYIQIYNNPGDFSGLYRKNTQESVVKAYIIEYKQKKGDNELVAGLFDEIPKKDLASCVKYILKIADEHWLTPEVQIQIARGDSVFEMADGSFDTAAVRNLFRGTGRGQSVTKRMILAVIFRHFDMFLTTTSRFDKEDKNQIVSKEGLATCIAPNFFPDAPPPDLATLAAYSARERQFILNVIDHTNQIFRPEDDPVESGDRTGIPLLSI